MNRHGNREYPPETRYSNSSPPPNQEEALRRLDEVTRSIVKTETSLQTKEESAFVTHDEFNNWKTRAMLSLGYQRKEKEFLLKFTGQNVPDYGACPQETDPRKLAALNEIATEFLTKTCPYSSSFPGDGRIRSREEVNNRRNELLAQIGFYHDFIVLLRAEALRLQCSGYDSITVKKRVSAVVEQMEKERRELKHLPTQNSRPEVLEFQNKIRELKGRLCMEPTEIVVWLTEIILRQHYKISMTPEEHTRFNLIVTYAQLTAQRQKAEKGV